MAKKYKEICEEQKEIIKVLESKLETKTKEWVACYNELTNLKLKYEDKLNIEIAAKDAVIDSLTEKLNNANEVAAHYEQLADNTYNDCKAELTAKDRLLETKTKEFDDKFVKEIADKLELRRKYEALLAQSKTDNESLNKQLKSLDNQLVDEINNNYELKRKVKAHDTMSIVFGLVAVLAILGCIIFG